MSAFSERAVVAAMEAFEATPNLDREAFLGTAIQNALEAGTAELQAQRNTAMNLLYESKDALYDLMRVAGVTEHPMWSRIDAFLETL